MTAPALTREQRREGFERALEIRKARQMIKLRIACGDIRIKDCFELDVCQGMKVIDLLMALPRVGERLATLILEDAGIPVKNTVKRCGTQQREKLFRVLGRKGR